MHKKILHIFLASLILFASAGITISKQLCGDQVKQVTVYEAAPNCDEIVANTGISACPLVKACIAGNDRSGGCCNHEVEFKKTDLFKEQQTDLLPLLHHAPVVMQYDAIARTDKFYDNYIHPPPLIGPDIPILVQSFRC